MDNNQKHMEDELVQKHVQRSRKQNLADDFSSMQARARAITVGTAFGGSVEVSLRKANGNSSFVILQPVETVELIHQLAAIIGCHIHLQPRKDFASWRKWNHTEEELTHYRGVQHSPGVGHPPHSSNDPLTSEVGAALPPPEQQPGLNFERKENEPVATKKTVNRRSTKRAAAIT